MHRENEKPQSENCEMSNAFHNNKNRIDRFRVMSIIHFSVISNMYNGNGDGAARKGASGTKEYEMAMNANVYQTTFHRVVQKVFC